MFTGVNDTANKFVVSVVDTCKKTVLPKPASLDLKMKNKQKFKSKVHSTKLLTKYEKNEKPKIFLFYCQCC
jgi:hypothetical protein